MKAIVLDDVRRQADTIREAFTAKNITATVCSSSNEFMEAVDAAAFDIVYINAAVWNKGRCIYDYFGIGQKIGGRPAVFYNADETFHGIGGRLSHEQDRFFQKPSDIKAAIDAA